MFSNLTSILCYIVDMMEVKSEVDENLCIEYGPDRLYSNSVHVDNVNKQ